MGPRKHIVMSVVVALATAVSATGPARAAQTTDAGATPGRGTAASSVRAVTVAVDGAAEGADVLVHLLDLQSTATLDRARQGSPTNHAEGTLKAATVDLGSAAPAFVPRELGTLRVFRDEVGPGADRGGDDLAVGFAVPGDLSATAAGAADPEVARLLTDLDGVRSAVVPDGLVAKGSVRPVDLEAVYGDAGATFTGGSVVDTAELVGGVAALTGATVTDQQASATPDLARSSVREFGVESVRVLAMDELLGLLGIDPGAIPVATLAALADSLGVPVSGALGSVSAASIGSTWSAINQALAGAQAAAAGQATEGCALLPGETTALLASVGVACSGTVQQALDAVTALVSELVAVVEPAVFDAALVSADGVSATVQAVAHVSEDGTAETSAAASGFVEDVRVAGVSVGPLAADLTTTGRSALERQWDALAAAAKAKVDAVLALLGEAYAGLVTVVVVPSGTQRTEVDGDYGVADAGISLLRVRVTPPASLPAPQDIAAAVPSLPPVAPDVTEPTLPGVPTTLPALPVLPTLPIAHVRAQAAAPTVSPLGSLTIDVGVLSAHAEHTRPGVDITGGGDNRRWDSRSGFGPAGGLPRTGSDLGWLAFAALFTGLLAWHVSSRLNVRAHRGV